MTAENRLRQLEQSVSLRETLIEKFIRYGVCLKEQWNRLFNGETVQSNHIVVRGSTYPLDNPLHMRLEEGHIRSMTSTGSRSKDSERNQEGTDKGI